jgi:N,N'-diacetylbacillosaminyl-diphospho-undecaprenol alpha-1,3-N-acetylgalactosaminyltransferase
VAKFLYICNSDGALFKFRYPLIQALLSEGHEVHTISSPSSPEGSFIPKLKELGVITHTINFDGRNASVFNALVLIKAIRSIIVDVKPEFIHCFTHKANILGGFANLFSNQSNKIFFSITGAGLIYTEKSIKFKLAKSLFNILYKLLSIKVEKVFFQNPDDIELFVKSKVFKPCLVSLTNGSGFDVKSIPKFSLAQKELLREKYNSQGKIVILYPSRALYEKGVREYYSAAAKVSNLTDKFIFIHLGSPADSSESGYTENDLVNTTSVQYLGHQTSIYEYIELADVVVLPSYREGTPRAIIEALSFDKFIITTDAPGCNETVINDWNGFLVKPRDINSLIAAFMKLTTIDLANYSQRSALLFDKKYQASHIIRITLDEYFNEKN